MFGPLDCSIGNVFFKLSCIQNVLTRHLLFIYITVQVVNEHSVFFELMF